MNKIEQELKQADLNIKTIVDWDDIEKVQQLTLYLREIQTELQTKMTQSIESHILGKQKIIALLNDSLPILLQNKKHDITVDPQLNSLIEMMQVRTKIDYSLEKLQPIVNKLQQ